MSKTECMGYTVETVPPKEGSHPDVPQLAYFLTGRRGATYGLMRYPKTPHLMFAVNARNGVICGLKGNYTFTDEGGELRPRS